MSFDALSDNALNYDPCRYGSSKLNFRGPERDLGKPYVAFMGGSETYGKFVEQPFVSLLDDALDVECVNFGLMNAGVDVFYRDAFLAEAAADAALVVFQVLPAQNLSNRLYSVHPRRNDRFLNATAYLEELYPEVDFATFHFTRHLLSHLRQRDPQRYKVVEEELQSAWVARMHAMLAKMPSNVLLAWISSRRPGEGNVHETDPLHVTQTMLDEVSSKTLGLVEICLSPSARASGVEGMVFNEMDHAAALEMLSAPAHEEVSAQLLPVLKRHLSEGK